jgi:hypothetical protein
MGVPKVSAAITSKTIAGPRYIYGAPTLHDACSLEQQRVVFSSLMSSDVYGKTFGVDASGASICCEDGDKDISRLSSYVTVIFPSYFGNQISAEQSVNSVNVSSSTPSVAVEGLCPDADVAQSAEKAKKMTDEEV